MPFPNPPPATRRGARAPHRTLPGCLEFKQADRQTDKQDLGSGPVKCPQRLFWLGSVSALALAAALALA